MTRRRRLHHLPNWSEPCGTVWVRSYGGPGCSPRKSGTEIVSSLTTPVCALHIPWVYNGLRCLGFRATRSWLHSRFYDGDVSPLVSRPLSGPSGNYNPRNIIPYTRAFPRLISHLIVPKNVSSYYSHILTSPAPICLIVPHNPIYLLLGP